MGDYILIRKIVGSGVEVISHNVETVERLTAKVRDARASYKQSLRVLRNVKEINPKVYTKSSIMLGLGEQQNEVVGTMDDLRSAGVDIFTMGQYLQPTPNSLEVSEYVSLDQFEVYKRVAESKGFVSVAS